MGRFDDRIALVTGGGSGIGRASAILFAREGAKVAVADIDPEGGQGTVRIIEDTGGDAVFLQADLMRAVDAQRVVESTVKRFGKLDVLANILGNAPVRKTLVDTNEEEWELMLRLNLTSVYLVSKPAIPHIKAAGGGAIVNVGALGAGASGQGMVANAPLAAAKGGVIALTKAMAADHAKDGIRVNCISPGAVLSPQMRRNRTPEEIESFGKAALLERLGEPEDLAKVVVFLASDEASYMTGKIVEVDGGR